MKKTAFVLATAVAVLLSACGQQQSEAPEAPKSAAPAVAPASAPATAAPAVPANAAGASVYNKTCALCHAAGVAGAPKPGNKDEWGPRIAQGKDVLYKHALEGFTGEKGNMPARGGASALSDDEVKAAVDYMVEKSS